MSHHTKAKQSDRSCDCKLMDAIKTVRCILLQRGWLYDAFQASIQSALTDCYETDSEQLALHILERLIGEPE